MIVGTRLGRYVLLGKFAAGGMAEVFLARQDGPQGFTKTVVIKRIDQRLSTNHEFVKMFLDEARLAALINHPNVVSIYELGEDAETGSYFMAMEFIDGCTLKRVAHQARGLGRPLPPALCARIIADACAGLDFAHNLLGEDGKPLQIVHRDVSPDNILVSYSGQVKVVDFGIAKATISEGHTRTGQLKGKFGYMSPEQLLGQPLDRRGDVWALGVVLYWLLAGVKPFRGESEGEVVHKIIDTPPPPLLAPEAPPALVEIVGRALTKDPEQRYPTARALKQDLEGWLARDGLLAAGASLGDYMAEHFPAGSDHERLVMRSLLTGTLENTPSRTDNPRIGFSRAAPGGTAATAHPSPEPRESTIDIAIAAGLSRKWSPGRLGGIAGVAIALALGGFWLAEHRRAPAVIAPAPVPTAAVIPSQPPAPAAEQAPAPAAVPAPPPALSQTALPPSPSHGPAVPANNRHHKLGGAHNDTPGEIAFVVSPWANVFVDGQPAGMTPLQPIEAAPGTHHVRLVNDALHADRELSITVHAGQTAQVKARLDPEP